MGSFSKMHSFSHRTIVRCTSSVRCAPWNVWEPSVSPRCRLVVPLHLWNPERRWIVRRWMNSESSRAVELEQSSNPHQNDSIASPNVQQQQSQQQQSHSSTPFKSQSTPKTRGNPAKDHQAFVVARQLLNLPIGSFRKQNDLVTERAPPDALYPIGKNPPVPNVNHYQMAADVLQFFIYERTMCASNARAINAAFAVLERLIREITYTDTVTQNLHYTFRNNTQFRMLMNFWKNAALAEELVLPAIEMIKKIQWMTSELPSDSNKVIHFDKQVLSMILQVMLKQVPKHQAPLVAETLMEFVYATIARTNNVDLEPDIFIYGQLMHAWINSDRPETPSKLDSIVIDMQRHEVALNNVTYGMLIRYWAGKGSLTRIRDLFEHMIANRLEPDVSCLGQALYGYTRAMQPLPAIELLEKMYQVSKKRNPQDRVTITASTLNILDSFKRLIDRGSDVAKNVTRAEEVVRKFETHSHSKSRSDDRVHGALMDIYAHVGRADDVEAMMQKIDQRDPVKYSILVRAYGKMDRADLAMDVAFSRMLNDPNVDPAPHVFKTLMEAWAVSSQSDAVDQAYSVIQLMDESAICQAHNVRPDSFLFGGLLKVVGASKRFDCGTKAIAILDDMERRAQETNDKRLLPNKVIYDLALNVCLQGAHDIQRTEEILQRMEASDYPPDIRLYNEVLSNYSLVDAADAPERAEKLLAKIKELSKSNAQLKPNTFTYNTVINCWVASKDLTATDCAWNVYEKMRKEHVLPNNATFNALIPFYSKSPQGFLDVHRADELLELMESGTILAVAPDRRHYGPVMNGWISIGEAQRASDVLLRRVKTYISATGPDKERCKPTPDHFYLVANSWIRLDRLVEATEFIEQMQELCDKNHVPEGPDLYSYLTLHSAWSRSNHHESGRYLEKLDATILKLRKQNR